MSIEIEIIGENKIMTKANKLGLDTIARTRKALFLGGQQIASNAINSIQQGPATGKTYGVHQASAPGEPPATDTGSLVSSINVDIKGGGLEVDIKAGKGNVNYAAALEFGTADGKIAPRPFFKPAFQKALPFIKRKLSKI